MFKNLRSLFIFFAFVAVCSAPQLRAQSNAPRVRTFDAQHYTISTSFNRQAKTITGETTIVLKPLQDNFKSLTLDAANLRVSSVTLKTSNKVLPFRIADDKLTVTLDKSYAPVDSISLEIKYTARPRKGLYFIGAKDKGQKITRGAQIWTQGEPEDSRHWFPSYDYPDDKATSEQFITTAADETAIANGELVNIETKRNGTKTFHFKMNVPHSTYLTSLVVGKYVRVSDQYNKIPLGYYVYPGTESIVEPAYGKTKKMFQTFEKLLDYKFPFLKYDQTIVAEFKFGGMENVTATTMADDEILKAVAGESNVEVENLVSHELAHSWFGNLVTCKNWSELWLNEGFATFMESVFLENEYGREVYLSEMRKNAAQYFAEELVGIKHPLVNLRAKPDILLFDSTTYKKGGFVVHMLRETVGDEMFWKSINVYLNANKFQNVETQNLQTAFERTTGKDLNWFFDQWIRKAGFPRLKIEPSYNPARKQLRLTIKQTQKSDSQTPEVFRIFAELEIQNSSGEKQIEKIEINQREQTFTFSVAEKPANIVFDKREQVLKRVDIASITAF